MTPFRIFFVTSIITLILATADLFYDSVKLKIAILVTSGLLVGSYFWLVAYDIYRNFGTIWGSQ